MLTRLLAPQVSANPIEEDHLIMEAIQLAQQRKFDGARDVAESVLLSNPHNATALQVNASECESRQDWAEAVRAPLHAAAPRGPWWVLGMPLHDLTLFVACVQAKFFLSGIHHNTVDGAMEHGFQTNIDLLRATRPRWVERGAQNKWDDVLTFKPRPVRTRTGTPEEKPPWYRLGAKFEEVLADPGYVNDLLETCPDPEEEREELRRVIWENHNYLDVLYAYYAADLNETWDLDKPVPNMIKHTGDEEEEEDDSTMLRMKGLMRILKDCKIPIGDVKVKLPLAVFDRVHLQGHLLTATKVKEDPGYTIADVDPHQASSAVSFYSFIETLIRCANLKLTTYSGVFKRFEALMTEHIREFALKKQSKKEYLDFRNGAVQACLGDETTSGRLRRIFEYFITSYKSNKVKVRTKAQAPLPVHAYSAKASLLVHFRICRTSTILTMHRSGRPISQGLLT